MSARGCSAREDVLLLEQIHAACDVADMAGHVPTTFIPTNIQPTMNPTSWIAVLLALAVALPACAQITPDAQTGATDIGLRPLADKRGLLFGTAAPIGKLNLQTDGGQFQAALKQHFNMVEPENDFKPPAIWRDRETYNFDTTDTLLGAPGQTGWAQANQIAVRGHVLVYGRDDGYSLPNWLLTGPNRTVNKDIEQAMTRAEATELLRKYIFAVAGRYRGKIAQWDVINETIDDNGNNSNPFRLRDSFWFRKLGVEFVELCFRFAREADPNAKLYYNDYGIEGLGGKADAVFALVKDLKAKGVPIDGVGMQWHIGVGHQLVPGDRYYQNAKRFQDLGVDLMITELDVGVPVVVYDQNDPRYGLEPSNAPDLFEQARLYRDVMRYALSFPCMKGVNIWGLSDKYSWIPGFTIGRLKRNPPGIPQGAALLLDANYKPKPAFWQLREELIHNAPAPN